MATFRSGNGGYVQISTNGVAYTNLDNALWELNEDIKKTENSHSGTQGSSNYEKVIDDNSWRLQIPWDEERIPESLGLRKGAKIYIRFKHGSGAVLKALALTLVEHFKTVNDNQGDIVRVEADGCGGIAS